MATVATNYAGHHHVPATMSQVDKVAAVLRWTYGLVPIVAGADKFMHLLTDWNKYLAPVVTEILPVTPNAFMSVVGIIEIVAGIIVLARPKVGALIVGLWLLAIAINLLMTGQYFDVAVRDIVMAIGAFCLHTLYNDNGRRNGD